MSRNKVITKKIEYFESFIGSYDSINLVLGNSMVEDAIIPNIIGNKWFSFTNEGQTIYESYKFLDYYKASVQIDTIIIGINTFDFPYSYINKM